MDYLNYGPSGIEKFIIYYKAALEAGLSREQLAHYLGMIPNSVMRKRLKVMDSTGLRLGVIESTGERDIPIDLYEKFENIIEKYERQHSPQRLDEIITNKKYVITSAQNATPVNKKFLQTILNYCNINDAEFLVIPLRYKNPTSIWVDESKASEWWATDIEPYIQDYSRKLGKSLEYMGHIKIQPTAVHPLSGFESYTGESSGIFGHPKIQLISIATPSKKLPKILTTTGTITNHNFTDSKAGHKGAFHLSFAAVVVEIDSSGHHHIRHIHWNDSKSGFYDLDSFYTSTGVSRGHRIKGLVTGDTHAEFLDDKVESATYIGPDSLCGFLRPQYLIWHDVEDFYRRNHHHKGDDILSYGKHHLGRNNVEEGLQITADLIDKYSMDDTINVIVKSNHDEAFDRWLREADPKSDPENAKFFHYMKYHQYKNIQMTPTGFKSIDPFAFWCNNPDEQRGLMSKHNTIFLSRNESNMIDEIELGFHGDAGPNGVKGSIRAFSRIGPKVIIGHSHSPGIVEGAYQVGVSARLDLEYNRGPSSWMHTHCIIYPDGTRTLVHIVDGKYKA